MIAQLSFQGNCYRARGHAMLTTAKVATLVGLIILAPAEAASACRSKCPAAQPAHAYPQYDLPPHLRPCYSLDDCDRKAFDESGTRGRMGLGADPAHPEGPGNPSY